MEDGYEKCYACGKKNPIGLKLAFYQEEGKVKSEFVPDEYHQGWPGVVHGGVICALLDEAMGYITHYQGIKALTAKMEIRFFRPAKAGQKLFLVGEISRKNRKLVNTRSRVELEDGSMVAEATALMYIAD